VSDEGPDLPMLRGNFEAEKGRPTVKYRDSAVSCAKTVELVEMPFEMRTQK